MKDNIIHVPATLQLARIQRKQKLLSYIQPHLTELVEKVSYLRLLSCSKQDQPRFERDNYGNWGN